jgi:hypothetical protein
VQRGRVLEQLLLRSRIALGTLMKPGSKLTELPLRFYWLCKCWGARRVQKAPGKTIITATHAPTSQRVSRSSRICDMGHPATSPCQHTLFSRPSHRPHETLSWDPLCALLGRRAYGSAPTATQY